MNTALAHLLGVVPPIPGLELLAGMVLLEEGQHRLHLLLGTLHGGGPDLVQEAIDGRGLTGHFVRNHIRRVALIAEQVGLLDTQAHEVVDKLLIIVLVVVVAAIEVSRVELLAQRTVGRVGQEGNQARLMERKDKFFAQAQLLCLLASLVTHTLRKTTHLLLLQHQLEGVILGQEVTGILHRDGRKLLVDRLQALLLLPSSSAPERTNSV